MLSSIFIENKNVRQRAILFGILLFFYFETPVHSQVQEASPGFFSTLLQNSMNLFKSAQSLLALETSDIKIDATSTEGLSNTIIYQALTSIREQIPPFFYSKYAILTFYDETEQSTVQFVSSIDNYKRLYSFVRLDTNKKVLAFLLPRIHKEKEISYRLAINGIWSYDRNNPNHTVDQYGVRLSTLQIPALEYKDAPSFVVLDDSSVRFSFFKNEFALNYQSTSLDLVVPDTSEDTPIFLNASFTGWNPLILKLENSTAKNMNETSSVEISLTPGVYYYYFQVGNTRILDPRNEDIVRLQNGLYVNRIMVKEYI